MSETTRAARAGIEVRHDLKFDLHHRDDHELRDALAGREREGFMPSIPARNHEFPLIVRINQADEIAEHDAVAMAETGARQNDCGESRVLNIDRKTGGDELGPPGRKLERFIETGPKIQAG